MKYKKSLLAAACAVGILTLSGCGSDSDDSASSSSSVSVPTYGVMAQNDSALPVSVVINYSNVGSSDTVSVTISDTSSVTNKLGFQTGQSSYSQVVSYSGEEIEFDINGVQDGTEATLGDHTISIVTKINGVASNTQTLTVKALPNGQVGLSTLAAQDTFVYSVAASDTVKDSVSYTFDGMNWSTINCPSVTDNVLGLSVDEAALGFACGNDSGAVVNNVHTSSGAATYYWVLNGTTVTSGSGATVHGDQFVTDAAPFSVALGLLPSGATLSSGGAMVGYAFAANTNATSGVEAEFTGIGGVTSGAGLETSFDLAENAIAAVTRESTSNNAGLYYAFNNATSGSFAIGTGLGGTYLNSYADGADPYAAGKNTVAWQSMVVAAASGNGILLNYAVPRGTSLVEQTGIAAGPVSSTFSDNLASTDVAENTIVASNIVGLDVATLDIQGAFFIDSDTTASGAGIYDPQFLENGSQTFIDAESGVVGQAAIDSGASILTVRFAFSGDETFTEKTLQAANAEADLSEGVVALSNSTGSGASYYIQGYTSGGSYVATTLRAANGDAILVGTGDSGSFVTAPNTVLYSISDTNTDNNPNTYGYVYQPANSTTPTYNSSINSQSTDAINDMANSGDDNMGNTVALAANLEDGVVGNDDQVIVSIDGSIYSGEQQTGSLGIMNVNFVSQNNIVVSFPASSGFAFLLSGNSEEVLMPAR